MVSLIAAKASSFVLTQKDQKVKSVEMLLCRTRPLLCKSGKTWAGNFYPACATLIAITLLQKSRYALPRTRPPSFCLLSSEAVLPTGKIKQKSICASLRGTKQSQTIQSDFTCLAISEFKFNLLLHTENCIFIYGSIMLFNWVFIK
nr:hypothetical protein [Mucilaginibacter sp. X5P1]